MLSGYDSNLWWWKHGNDGSLKPTWCGFYWVFFFARARSSHSGVQGLESNPGLHPTVHNKDQFAVEINNIARLPASTTPLHPPPPNKYLVYICTNINNRFTLVSEQQKHKCTGHRNGQTTRNRQFPHFVESALTWICGGTQYDVLRCELVSISCG